jgi:tetratricopeptide (TPR) repeat protein
MFAWARQYDEATEQLQRTLGMDPNSLDARILLGEAYIVTGRYEEAIAEYQKALTIAGDTTYALWALGWADGVAGQKDEAVRVLEQLEELSEQGYVPLTHRAFVYLGLGKDDEGFALAHKGCLERDQILVG